MLTFLTERADRPQGREEVHNLRDDHQHQRDQRPLQGLHPAGRNKVGPI